MRDLADTIEAILNEKDPLRRLAIVASELQPAVGYLLRDLVTESIKDGKTWKRVGEAMEMNHTTAWAQYVHGQGGPMLGGQARTNYRIHQRESVERNKARRDEA